MNSADRRMLCEAGNCLMNGDNTACNSLDVSDEEITFDACRRRRSYSLSQPPVPWFGIDIGGTLVKIVYFEITDGALTETGSAESVVAQTIRRYLTGNVAYGSTGFRDAHLQLENQTINGRTGTLHFIRFPTSDMPAFLNLAEKKGFASCSSTVCATGGGAYLYENVAEERLNLRFHKFDELHSLITGIRYIVDHNPTECYYYENPLDESTCRRAVFLRSLGPRFLVVNIGSGVSVLAVDGPDKFRRVTGTSLGGGMFFGLCCLLTGCETFEEAIKLSQKGDNLKVDKLVRDIYGGDYSLFNLKGDTVASSFGNMIHPDKRATATKEDLARSALVTVTSNITSIAYMCAKNEVLILYLQGYFGAVGCLMNLMCLSETKRAKSLQ
ncbi:unnamed protein product [Soboliphyme baturini]|uniref:pantothenate kinase n=1 Tax=Soboliphyme baturini TaxID=241478 RepID=A0A183IJ34_9BILA|nr:unnamed protein product [Soboliphyme baturini]